MLSKCFARGKIDFRASSGSSPHPANDPSEWPRMTRPQFPHLHMLQASSLHAKGFLTLSTPVPSSSQPDSAYNYPFCNLGIPICAKGWGSDTYPPTHPDPRAFANASFQAGGQMWGRQERALTLYPLSSPRPATQNRFPPRNWSPCSARHFGEVT